MEQELQEMLYRLKAIDTSLKQSKIHVPLFIEFYRQLLHFAQANGVQRTMPYAPFETIVEDGVPDIAPKLNLIKEHLNEIQLAHDTLRRISYENALKFIAWKHDDIENRSDISNPYEAIVILYERGGSARRYKGSWQIGESMPIVNWSQLAERKKPYISLLHSDLDKLEE